MTRPDDPYAAGEAMRRAVMGDDFVDAQSADPNPAGADFQRYLTESAWGVWARQGPLSTRDRSMLVIAMTRRPRPHRRTDGARAGFAPCRASPTPSSTNCRSRSPPTPVRRPGGRPISPIKALRAEERGSDVTTVGVIGLGNMGSVLAEQPGRNTEFDVVTPRCGRPGRQPRRCPLRRLVRGDRCGRRRRSSHSACPTAGRRSRSRQLWPPARPDGYAARDRSLDHRARGRPRRWARYSGRGRHRPRRRARVRRTGRRPGPHPDDHVLGHRCGLSKQPSRCSPDSATDVSGSATGPGSPRR